MIISHEQVSRWEIDAELFCECHKMLNSQRTRLRVKETGGVLA